MKDPFRALLFLPPALAQTQPGRLGDRPDRLRATSVTEAETRQTSFRVSVLFAAKAHRPSGGPDGSFTNEDAITRHNGSGIHLPPAHARGLSVSDKA